MTNEEADEVERTLRVGPINQAIKAEIAKLTAARRAQGRILPAKPKQESVVTQ